MAKFLPLVVIIALAVKHVSCQIDVSRIDKSRITVVKEDPDSGKSEIYTSMRDLEWFFDREQSYIEDIRQILDKKLVGQKAVNDLGAYLASYDEIIGDQLEDHEFLK